LTDHKLIDLFAWTEADFLNHTEGTAIRRIGYQSWLRNIAVALGNAESNAEIISALELKLDDASPLLKEHVLWALEQHN
jgi:epoxyqueuosine reductase